MTNFFYIRQNLYQEFQATDYQRVLLKEKEIPTASAKLLPESVQRASPCTIIVIMVNEAPSE